MRTLKILSPYQNSVDYGNTKITQHALKNKYKKSHRLQNVEVAHNTEREEEEEEDQQTSIK